MPAPNVLSALRAMLRASGAVTAIAPAERIFAGELPGPDGMPRACVVLSYAGGPADHGVNQYGRTRVDVRCYGATVLESMNLHAAVHELFKYAKRQRVTSSQIVPTLVHAISPEGGPTSLRDADGDWPMTFRSYEVLAAEVAA